MMDEQELQQRATARQRLEATTKVALTKVHTALNGGRLGYDAARVSKQDMVERILAGHAPSAVLEALEAHGDGAGAAAGAGAAGGAGDAVAALQAALAALIAGQQRGGLDADAITAIVDARLEAAQIPRRLVVKVGDAPVVELDGHQHPLFPRVLALLSTRQRDGFFPNILLKGPAGCGKTHLASQVARALGRTYASISGSAGVSEAQLTGRLLPTGEAGRFQYHSSPLVDQYMTGGLFLLDEMDAFDPNALVSTNSALANGEFFVEARAASGLDTRVPRHRDSIILASANTFGTGADAMYVGRNPLDAATLTRFIVLEMDYDRGFERTQTDDARLLEFVWALRDKATEHRIRRPVSTRMIQQGDTLLRAGLSWADTRETLLAGWTRDERSKCGVAA